MPKYYVWVDIESTGLEFDGSDEVLEIAAVLTDADYKQVGVPFEAVLQPSSEWLDKMGDYVRTMHQSNGLIDDIVSGWGELPSASNINFRLIRWLKDQLGLFAEIDQGEWSPYRAYRGIPKDYMLVLAGASVQADEKWMRHNFPGFFELLHYRQNDVSCLRGFIEDFNPAFIKVVDAQGTSNDLGGKNHRALYDINKSINQMRLIRAYAEKDWNYLEVDK